MDKPVIHITIIKDGQQVFHEMTNHLEVAEKLLDSAFKVIEREDEKDLSDLQERD